MNMNVVSKLPKQNIYTFNAIFGGEMSKKFIVEAKASDMSAGDIDIALTSMEHYAIDIFTVTELPPAPEVKMVETGILNIPDLCTLQLLAGKVFNSGEKVNLSIYPTLKSMCLLIETIWDFSSIPVGSLIKVEFDANGFVVGYYVDVVNNYLRVKHGDTNGEISGVHSKQIKSIRIIELPKENQNENT